MTLNFFMESCTPEDANTEGNIFLDLAQYKPSSQEGYFIPKRGVEIFGGWGGGRYIGQHCSLRVPKPRLTMKGQDARSLCHAARWGRASTKSRGPATSAPSAGYFLGPLMFPQELARAAFPSRFIPSWFICCICLLVSLA